MVVKLLGIADLLSALVVVLLHYQIIGWKTGLLFATYLVIKGIIFRKDITSLIDILSGAYMIVLSFGFSTFITWVIAIYLFQKACFSLAA